MQRNFKPDDGSQQWLDEMAINRIRRKPTPQHQSMQPQRQQIMMPEQKRIPHPVLDRKISVNNNIPNQGYEFSNTKLMPGETVEDVKRAKNYAEKTYMRMPHVVSPLYAPGAKYLRERGADAISLRNLSEQVSVNTDVDNLSGRIQSAILNKFGAGDSQDALLASMHPGMRMQVTQKLQQLQQGQWVAPNTLLPQMQQNNNNNPQGCKVISGYPAFQQIQVQGFGNTTPLVRAMGQIPPQMSGIDFVIREVVRAYIIHPNETTINLAAIQANPQALTELVVLQAPPMTNIGIILVPKEAVANGMGGGRQVLTDARQRNMAPQQNFLHQNQRQIPMNMQGYHQQPIHSQQQMIYAHNQPNMNKRGILKG